MMRKRITRSESASFAFLLGVLICSNRKRASLSFLPPLRHRGDEEEDDDDFEKKEDHEE